MLFQGKDFSWVRHIIIAVVLLTFINLLVIFAPSILGIFGLIGVWQCPVPVSSAGLWLTHLCLSFPFLPHWDQAACGGPSLVPAPSNWFPCTSCLPCCPLTLALPLDISLEPPSWAPPAWHSFWCQGADCRGGYGDSARTWCPWVPGKLARPEGGRRGREPSPAVGLAHLSCTMETLCPLCPCLLQVPPLLPASSLSSRPSSTSALCPRTRSHCVPLQKSW